MIWDLFADCIKQMKIDRVELYRIELQLQEPFQISSGTLKKRDSLIVKVYADGVVGYGESAPMPEPFYSYETLETCRYIISDFLIPVLKDKEIKDPYSVISLFAHVRGHPFAKAGIETAIWDWVARKEQVSLAIKLGNKKDSIESGIALGIYRSEKELLKAVEKSMEEGYKRVKIKIKHGWDVKPVSAIRKKFPSLPLMVDANADYTLEDISIFKELDKYNLMMIEQPLYYNDLFDHAKLQKKISTPVCLDESIHSINDAIGAISLKSCKIMNIKIQRVGGLANARKIHDLCKEAKIPVWCGTMPESGIGQCHGLALAGLENFKYPADLEPSLRFFKDDLVNPLLALNRDGTISIPKSVGLGVVDEKKLKKYTSWKKIW